MKTETVQRREIVAWAFYDFANSGYTTVVLTAMFNAYFVSAVAGNAAWATFAWTLTLSVSYAITMLLGPWVGAWADAHAAKKNALAVVTTLCVIATALLATVKPGGLALACVLIIVSNVCFSLGENLAAGFLPELATGEKIAKVSAFGWSVGYVGGLIALGISLAIVQHYRAVDAPAAVFVGVSMLMIALLYALAAIPLFVFVRERAQPTGLAPSFAHVLGQLRSSLVSVRAFPELQRFMFTALFYQAGVSVVITLAAVYAEAALGFKTEDTIKMLIVVNVTAAIGAAVFGWAQDRFGHRQVLTAVLIVWVVAIAVLALKTDRFGFWIAANLAGLGLGACQSGGRALVGYLAPTSKRAEFYGVWGFYTRASAILGPMTYGIIAWATAGNHRLAMLLTGGFFVVALVLLQRVDVPAGRARVN